MEDILILNSDLKKDASINIGGYKHVFVTVISAVLASDITATLYNVPDILDTYQIISILKRMGKKVEFQDKILKIYEGRIINDCIDNEMSNFIHGSIYLFLALVVGNKTGAMYSSGGCRIGTEKNSSSRPEQHFFDVMKRFGITLNIDNDGKKIASYTKLTNIEIDILDYTGDNEISSNLYSGATKAAILCSIGTKTGVTKIKNPYLKPDVTELLSFLKKIGYKINVTETLIQIEPPELKKKQIEFKIMPDISEIISFIGLSAFNEIDLNLVFDQKEKVKNGLKEELFYLKKSGVPFIWKKNGLKILGSKKNILESFSITVTSSSIFSDSQPFFSILALKSNATSTIKEGIWTSRFDYAKEAKKLGYPFNVTDNELKITPWDGALTECDEVTSRDLRAAFALLALSLNRKKSIKIKDFYHVHRGYEKVYDKLSLLGIKFKIL